MLTGCRAVFGGLQLHKYKVEGGSPCLKEYLLTSLIRTTSPKPICFNIPRDHSKTYSSLNLIHSPYSKYLFNNFNMKTYQYAAVAASLVSSTYAQYPSCASSCVNAAISGSSNLSQLCSDPSKLSTAQSCVSSSTCSDSDKNSMSIQFSQRTVS